MDFDIFDWVHTGRLANVAAHLCAKHASAVLPVSIWHDGPPTFLVSSLLSDCNQGEINES
jgi:hypothetical protein